ncbi:DUF5074 domain-containing protein [Rufibacter sediminis]|uniref:SMP-30/Gluconolactonase/LRE-like region domain-containing protein n=1 Tax=Rufibacter sediminis TaxID=2762756 RepID=A0ABR6VXG1_9BACT|nr:DUF5074 domain-containing protein [Rufibacter sediminis]MBC3541887.1 hypothetical protein [Rufibacter sediminis]
MKRLFLRNKALRGLLSTFLLVTISCKEEEKEVLPVYEAGVLISTESTAGADNGSVHYYDRATGTVEADLFNKVNGRTLQGNTLHMASAFEKTYLLTSNGRIEVLNSRTFTSAGTIQGFDNPQRFLAMNNSTGFVSDWGNAQADSGRVLKVNLRTNLVIDTVNTTKGPGAMTMAGGRLYVATNTNKIHVINTTSMNKDTTLTVGDNPNGMVVDASGILWVLCGGKPDATTPANRTKGQLIRITTNNLRAKPRVFDFPGTAFQPKGLALSTSRNRLYFIYDGIYVMETAATALPTTPLIKRPFLTLGQDPTDGLLYTARVAPDGTSGWVIRYRSTGAVIDSFQVKGVPNGFSFR